MKKGTVLALLGALLATQVTADLYINAFRGSNNRLDDRGRDRNNANRLFDSQNNDRGGYNVGKLSVYTGESVPISWTNQHSSGTYFLKNTEFIIQYACGALMRDGTTTTTIPQTPSECYLYDCDRDLKYGRHESYTDYQYCKATTRNKGLFTANQNLQGNGAIYTRQNPAGTRRGYECPEERDYYPYWRASIWKDIAVLTNHPERCTEYQAESFNVKGRYACVYDDYYWDEVLQGIVTTKGELPINETKCDNSPNFTVPSTNETRSKYYWKYFAPWGIDAPDCEQTITTRDNHHGLTGGRNYYTYEWTVPEVTTGDDATSCCVVRMRYNITTDDYDAWESDDSLTPGVNSSYNANVSNPDPDEDPAWVPIWERFDLTYSDVSALFTTARGSTEELKSRGYVFINNPRVDPFGLLFNTSSGSSYRIQLQLAINTNQFGRTFQDRTHCFQILDRPSTIDSEATIQLISVQGKRGNIVQVYPATEYFFVPEPVSVQPGDYVHFCWTGSNTNPENNDGQGLAGTDRSNVCPLTQEQYDKTYYSDIDGNVASGAVGDYGNSYPDYVDDPIYGYPTYYDYANKRGRTPSNMAGLDINVLKSLCTTRRGDDETLFDYGNMEQLDDAGTTYCIAPLQVSTEGTWNFLCTRNNNFSNRGQKGMLTVSNSEISTVEASSLGGVYSSGEGAAVLIVQPGMIESGNTLQVQVQTWYTSGDSTVVEISGADGGTFSSDTLVSGGWLELWIPYSPKALSSPVASYRADTSSSWKHYSSASIKHKHNTYYAVINISEGGYYRASNQISGGAIALFLCAIVGFLVVAGCIISKKCRKQ